MSIHFYFSVSLAVCGLKLNANGYSKTFILENFVTQLFKKFWLSSGDQAELASIHHSAVALSGILFSLANSLINNNNKLI